MQTPTPSKAPPTRAATAARTSVGPTATAPASPSPAQARKSTAAAGGAGGGTPSRPTKEAHASKPATAPATPSKVKNGTGVGAEPAVTGKQADAVALASAKAAESADAQAEPRALVLFDIDNTLYSAKLGIAQLMSVRIQAFFRDNLDLAPEKAQELHNQYYQQYGLAVRGLVRNHQVDPLEYDRLCDQSLPLDSVLEPDEDLKKLLAKFDRTKCRVIALTNAYKVHAHRVLNALEIAHFFEEVIYCDYAKPNFACKPEKEYFDDALASISSLDISHFKIPPPPHDRIGKTYFVDDSALNTRAARDVCKWYHVVHFKEPMGGGDGPAIPAGALALPAATESSKSKPDAVAAEGSAAAAHVDTDEASAAASQAAKQSDENNKCAQQQGGGANGGNTRVNVGAPPKPTALDISLLQQAATSSALALPSSVASSSQGDAARTQLLQQLVRLPPSVRLELYRALLDSTPASLPARIGASPSVGAGGEKEKEEDELDTFQAELDARRLVDEEARARAERRRRLALYGGLWGAMDSVPRKVIVKVLGMLSIEDVLVCRQVSKKWQALTYLPELWASHARQLMQNDPGGPPVGDPMAMTLGLGLALAPESAAPKGKMQGLGLGSAVSQDAGATAEGTNGSAVPGDLSQEGGEEPEKEAEAEADALAVVPRNEDGQLLPSEWELLVKKLVRRERNWAKGVAQKVQYMEGHTGFVTSMKLKGRKTLVTGSYDETIRVWDMHTGACTKVLKAKAIACLDFLLPSADGSSGAILCAGLYDTGRVMVWDMKTWTLLQTLGGHNRGIRNVALSEDVLVSVGQDKAIVFGQQSNVSLGISIVDKDKIVAVTVDGIIRTFCIRRKEMIGQFDLSKLGGVDRALSAQLAGIGGDGMLQWFAAHGNSMTLAAKNLVVHLEWTEHIVPVEENPVPLSRSSGPTSKTGFSASTSFRSSLGPSTPTAPRIRKDSSQTAASNSRPGSRASLSPAQSTNNFRQRVDSAASSASTATTVSSATSARTVAGGSGTNGGVLRRGAMSPSPMGNGNAAMNGSTGRTERTGASASNHRTSLSSSGRGGFSTPTPDQRRKSIQTNTNTSSPSPASRMPPLSPSSSFRFPTSSNSSYDMSPSMISPISDVSPSAAPDKPLRTRIAPNLEVAPRIVSVLRTPDISTGCTDPAKRRVVCSTRFSSRSGADRRLYASTYNVREGSRSAASTSTNQQGSNPAKADGSQDDGGNTPTLGSTLENVPPSPAPVSGSTQPADRDHSSSVVPIRGAWKVEADRISQPTRNPMAMILDHESCVVGCQDGTVYKLSFVGDEFDDAPEPEPEVEEAAPVQQQQPEEEESAGHVTISDLGELEHVWSELMLPDDAPEDHPGRWRPAPQEVGHTAMEQLGFK
ncbi:unnamed protein product [Tilletia caries]|nr:unnamed protein product [Tilletia caries]